MMSFLKAKKEKASSIERRTSQQLQGKDVAAEKPLRPGLSPDPRVCEYGDLLRKVPLLAQMGTPSIESLSEKMEIRRYMPGDFLIVHSALGHEVFILRKGSVRALDEQRKPLQDEPLGPGSYFGESFIMGTCFPASIICMEECEVVALPVQALLDLHGKKALTQMHIGPALQRKVHFSPPRQQSVKRRHHRKASVGPKKSARAPQKS